MIRELLDSVLGRSVSASGGEELRYNCPICEHFDRRLYVAPDRSYKGIQGWFFCFQCEWKGPLDYLLKTLGLPPRGDLPAPSLRELLLSLFPDDPTARENPREPVPWPRGAIWLEPHHKATHYLVNRGMTLQQIADYRLFLWEENAYMRIGIPEFDIDGNLVYYVSRKYLEGDKSFKYIGEVEGKRRRYCLGNLWRAITYPEVLVCEGALDAIAAGPNAIWTYGKYVTDGQLDLICSTGNRSFCVLLDGDAQEKAELLAERLMSRGLKTRIASLPPDKDPADLGPAGVAPFVDAAPELDDLEVLRRKLCRTVRQKPLDLSGFAQ